MSESRSKLPLYLMLAGGVLFLLGHRLWGLIAFAIGGLLLFASGRGRAPEA
jgi:hypothetical protein